MGPVPEEMIERAMRYSTNEQLQSRKTKAINKG
jgi:hypothetical protein